MSLILEARHLSKSYGSVRALTDFSIKVEPGSIYGILGPNGSGKTTCLSILLDVVKPEGGSYFWFGEVPSASIRRRRIGALLETPNFYPYLTAVQNLKLIATIKRRGEHKIMAALQVAGLSKRRNAKYSTYSLGMRQRLAVAAALLGNPEVLVLDEPTNGLDPQGIKEIRELITEIRNEGKTIIMASHLLDEVEKVCTHVAILKSGQLLAAGKVREVIGSENEVQVAAPDMVTLEEVARQLSGLVSLEKEGEVLTLRFQDKADTAALNRYFFDRGITLSLLNLKKKTLESQFMELTSHD
ncbi:MAG: ABC transporter ATP-binding protein [Chitinophagales bacterium]|nr:MAG: ABC transporter ATP-binding protein [Chitinophagales bacterium]